MPSKQNDATFFWSLQYYAHNASSKILNKVCFTKYKIKYALQRYTRLKRICNVCVFKSNSPDVSVFRRGKLLNEVTLLLSAERATDGSGLGVSECDRSCIALPPAPLLELWDPKLE